MPAAPTTWTTYASFASDEAALFAAIEPYGNNPLFDAGSKPASASFGYTTVGSTTYSNDPNDPAAAFTIGYGDNIQKLNSAQIKQDLFNAGIWQTLSTAEMTAIENYQTGDADSVNDITDAGFSLTAQQSAAIRGEGSVVWISGH